MKRSIRVTHFITSLERGGAQAVLYDLIMHMDAGSFVHTVVYIHGGPYVQLFQDAGVAVHQVRGWLFCYDLLFPIRLAILMRQLKPDCLHTSLWMANNAGRLIARLLGIPCVSALHNNLDQDGVVRNLIDRLTLVCAGELIAVSAPVADSLHERRWQPARIDTKKIHIIHNGIDASYVARRAQESGVSRERLGLSTDHFVIGSVGRLVAVKNYKLLLDSFAQLSQIHEQVRLVLVGNGPLEQELKAYAQQLCIASLVIFIGGQQAYGYYPLFDCFVQTSDKEGISIALLEAMSFGRACVVTSHDNEHPVISSEKDGVVVPAGDCQQIVAAINDIIANQAYRECLSYNAQATVKKSFDVSLMTAAYERIFIRQSH